MNNLNLQLYKKDFLNKGLTGLGNLGNTCFINSVLQCLSHTYELNTFLKNKSWQEKISDTKVETLLFLAWDKLRSDMWSDTDLTIHPHDFIDTFIKTAIKKDRQLFTGYRQNDTSEFLQFCIECFHTALSRPVTIEITGDIQNNIDTLAKKCYNVFKQMYSKEWSEIIPLFYGMEVTKIESLESNYVSYNPVPFFNLCLEIKGFNDLYSCLDSYTSYETLNEDNTLFIEETNKHERIQKSIQFFNLPKVLVISLKRFTNRNNKITTFIDFPLTLDMNKYICGYNNKSNMFELYGVCNHLGNTNGGHYTSYVKIANDEWYEFNDTSTRKININEIKSQYSYCLFYRKQYN